MFLNPLIKHICEGFLVLSLRIREDSEAISEPGLPYIVEKNTSNTGTENPDMSLRQTVQLLEL